MVELSVDNSPVVFEVLETGRAWRVKASVGGRVLTAAGVDTLPAGLAFALIQDPGALHSSRLT